MGGLQVVVGETFNTSKWRLGVLNSSWNKRHGSYRGEEETEAWEELGHSLFQACTPGLLFISTAGSVGSHSGNLQHPINDCQQCDCE